MSSRQSCLFVLSSAVEGVSAPSFIQAFTLTQSAFNVHLASPQGRAVEYVDQDENCRRWLADFRTKSFSIPASFDSIEARRFSALVLPHSPGAVCDLTNDVQLASLLSHFIQEKKPICAIGMGVAGLCCAKTDTGQWSFNNYSMTSTTVYELAKTPLFSSIAIIPEDFIKDHGGNFTGSEAGAVHVVVDRHLVTGQNLASTLIAIQNLILLCNQKPDH